MKFLDVPTVGFAVHDGHDDTKNTTSHFFGVVSLCRRVRRASRRLAVSAFLLAASSACATTLREPVVERPALEVPPPPPRVIAPLPVPDLPQQEPPVEDPAEIKPPAPVKPKPQPQAPKPEAKPDTPVDPLPPPVTAPPVAPPQPTLTTPPQGDATAIARQIRDSIVRTRGSLEKVNYGPLSNERKKAYDDAKLFATQADDALKANNLVFAKELADKAERLAKELQGR
jgi:hypothetical protein